MKEKFCTPGMNDSRKSDNNIVPEKPANNGAIASAEQVEGRALTEGNTMNTAAVRTQGRGTASIGLDGVRRKLSRTRKPDSIIYSITSHRSCYQKVSMI